MLLQELWDKKLSLPLEALREDSELTEQIQKLLFSFGLLFLKPSGRYGPVTKSAIEDFQYFWGIQEEGLEETTIKRLIETSPDDRPCPELEQSSTFASRIAQYMLGRYYLATGPYYLNIVYVEGCSPQGIVNDDAPNRFNDARVVFEIIKGVPRIISAWTATCEPGSMYTYNPLNPKGAARIALGQYKSWRVGTHFGGGSDPHEALVQDGQVTVFRDHNKDGIRPGDQTDTGLFDINQHWGYDLPLDDVSFASAGCLVGRTRQGHRDFMRIIKQDARYLKDSSYMFLTTVIPGNKL